jgi:hypothetical protein
MSFRPYRKEHQHMREPEKSRLDTSDPASPEHADQDHWDAFAEALELTIEGRRLIAEELVLEAKLLGYALLNRIRLLSGFTLRRGSTPSA